MTQHIIASTVIWIACFAGVAHIISLIIIGGAEPKINALMHITLLELFATMFITFLLEHVVVTMIAAVVSICQDYRINATKMAIVELGKEKIAMYDFKDGQSARIYPSHMFTDGQSARIYPSHMFTTVIETTSDQPVVNNTEASPEATKPEVSTSAVELNCSSIADNKTTPSGGSSVDLSVDDKGDISAAVTVANE